ncbi:MAG TPA: YncE family protein [Terriglobales bacterium]|nr:YncE family protein [Terriglobales bacterium]
MDLRSIPARVGASLAVAVTLVLAGLAQDTPPQPGPSGYHLLKTISVGGTEGWDYVTMDSDARRLYMGRDDHIDVVDVDAGIVVGKIAGLSHTHGMVLAPDLGRGFTSDGDANTSTIVDLKTLKKIGAVKTGKDPDSFVYDEVTKRVFIMNSAGNDVTAINAADGSVAGTIALDGQPEAGVADGKGKVFVNITDKNQIVEFDGKTLKVLHRWSLAPGEGPSGLAIDRKNRRLFSVCDNQKMVVMDADTGKVIATPGVGAGTDASLFDPDTGNAFASAGGSATLTVIHEDSPDQFRVVDNVPTQSGARTMALDTKTHNVLLITARHGHGATHSLVLPNTFVVLVIGK